MRPVETTHIENLGFSSSDALLTTLDKNLIKLQNLPGTATFGLIRAIFFRFAGESDLDGVLFL